MTVSEQHAVTDEEPSDMREAQRRPPALSTRSQRIVLVLAVLLLVGGVTVLLGGPARSLLQQQGADQKAEDVATDLTCFRYRSLEVRMRASEVGPVEIRRRASDLAIGSREARPEVAEAARRLADELNTAQVQAEDAAWAALADACGRS